MDKTIVCNFEDNFGGKFAHSVLCDHGDADYRSDSDAKSDVSKVGGGKGQSDDAAAYDQVHHVEDGERDAARVLDKMWLRDMGGSGAA